MSPSRHASSSATVTDAVAELAAGRMVVIVSGAGDAWGDLVVAAEHATPEAVNFITTHARGVLSLCLTEARCDALRLSPARERDSPYPTRFMNSIEARTGITTGVSAEDRAHTIRVAIDPACDATDLTQPGHVFPMRTPDGGVLTRAGHSEAAVDLARLAGLDPSAVLCAVLREDGAMAGLPELEDFCARHGLALVSVTDVVAHRRRAEPMVERVTEAALPVPAGGLRAIAFRETRGERHHVALLHGDPGADDDTLVAVHGQCLPGHALRSRACGCGPRLQRSLEQVTRAPHGVLVYLTRDPSGLSLMRALGNGACDGRLDGADRTLAAQILAGIDVRRARLLDDDPLLAAELGHRHVAVAGPHPHTPTGATA